MKSLDLYEIRCHERLDTRLLPKDLRSCKLQFCHLEGTVELRTLPKLVITLNLEGNRLCGIARLTKLPEGLETLTLSTNEFSRVIVRNASLPKSIKNIRFGQHQKMDVRTLDAKVMDSRISLHSDLYAMLLSSDDDFSDMYIYR